MWWSLWLSCECGPAAPPPSIPGHYPDFGALVDATARGDVAMARTIAGDLTSTIEAKSPGDEDALADLSAAAGFLRTAEDADDLTVGTVRLARSCGECHAGATPRLPVVTGHAVAQAAVAPLVWPGSPPFVPPTGADAASAAVRAAAAPSDPASGVLSSCQACHHATSGGGWSVSP